MTQANKINYLRGKYSGGEDTLAFFSFRDAFKRYVVSKQQSLIDLTGSSLNRVGSDHFRTASG